MNIDLYLDMRDRVSKYQPYRDAHGRVSEDPQVYALRMQISLLPNWPAEVLIEWLHRHADFIDTYAFLRFETFSFSRETWPLERIPDREAFADPGFCDSFSNIEERARYRYDWLAQYMMREGTWNTPIILLRNDQGRIRSHAGLRLKRPYHLLEGHRRLSFLNGLRRLGTAQPRHDVWVVTKTS